MTENAVIEGVKNFLLQKGKTENKAVIFAADAGKKEHGIDLFVKLGNNRYFVEAKGTTRDDNEPMRTAFDTNFGWVVSQIILRMKTESANYADVYGIAVPR
jgi:hypothetical protein